MRTRVLAAVILTAAIFGVPARGWGEPGRPELLDQLDEARIERDLLEIEVEAGRMQLQKMTTVLKETELSEVQGFSNGPIIASNDAADRESRIERYKRRLAEVRREFVVKSTQLGRERRRVAELESQLGLNLARSEPSTAAAPAWSERSLREAKRVLDLILRGVESWQGETAPEERPSPERRPAPEELGLKDAERLLDLIRKGLAREPRDPSPPAAPALPPAPSPSPEGRPAPAPRPAPEEGSSLKDAERLLELLLRGVESWRGR